MKVTNILSGRQIELHRANHNRQFDFFFSITAPTIRYVWFNEQTNQIQTDYIPDSIKTQYGVRGKLHSSMMLTLASGVELNRFTYYQSVARNPNLAGLPMLEATEEEIGSLQMSDATNFLCVAFNGVLHATHFVAVRDYPTTAFAYVSGTGISRVWVHDEEIAQTFSECISGRFRGDRAFFTTQELLESQGDVPDLSGYHGPTRNNDIFRDSSVEWFAGFEIEKEDLDIRNRCARAKCDLGGGWIAERDGSLDSRTGVEVVSPVLNLFDTKNIFEQFDKFDWVMNAEYSRACGGHITISRRDMSADELVDKLAPFVPMLFSLYEGRLSNQYGGIQNKDEIKNGSRRAINNCSRAYNNRKDAVEIRIFSAVSTLETIKWRTRLVQWICAQIDKDTFTSFTEVADAMFENKKLNKLLRSQYSAEKLARKQALTYVFGGCLEGQSSADFLGSEENYERTLERMKRAYSSVAAYIRREVEGRFSSTTIRKALGA